MVNDIVGRGTDVRVWRSWMRRFPLLDLTDIDTLVVVAPHPDDEVLGVGGLMCLAASAGATVRVVAVTDGDASHPDSPTLSPAQLRLLRPVESEAALAALGIDAAVTRLGVADGRVAQHEEQVTNALLPLLVGDRTVCLATWRGDGHPDHEATGRAAAEACLTSGARLLEYPVWMWHWAQPEEPTVPWFAAQTIALSEAVLQRKSAAVQCFRTQIAPLSPDPRDTPVLHAHMLDRLIRPEEMVFG